MNEVIYPLALQEIWDSVDHHIDSVGDLFENIIESFYTSLIVPGDLVLDGGAHSGRHTVPMAERVGESGRVLAFEPIPEVAAFLELALKKEGMQDRVVLSRDALFATPGEAVFHVVRNRKELSGLQQRRYTGNFVPEDQPIAVRLDTIDRVVKTSGDSRPLRFIKLDLENGEFDALRGGGETLKSHRPILVFENGLSSSAEEKKAYDKSDFFHLFRAREYGLFSILGTPVFEGYWSRPGPFYLVGLPLEKVATVLPILWSCVLTHLLPLVWRGRTGEAILPAALGSPIQALPPGFDGFLDPVEGTVHVRGWVAAPSKDRLPRQVRVQLGDCRTVVQFPLDRRRSDVEQALDDPSLEVRGFEADLPLPGVPRVQAFLEHDGKWSRLRGSATADGPVGAAKPDPARGRVSRLLDHLPVQVREVLRAAKRAVISDRR